MTMRASVGKGRACGDVDEAGPISMAAGRDRASGFGRRCQIRCGGHAAGAVSRRHEWKRAASSTVHQPPPATLVHAGAREAAAREARAGRRATCRRGAARSTPRRASSAPTTRRDVAPTSKRRGPIAGPDPRDDRRAASTSIAAIVASSTPAARPRQPACAARDDACRARSANSTGRQSAVRTATATPGCARRRAASAPAAARASASRRGSSRRRSSTTRVPCDLAQVTGRGRQASTRRQRCEPPLRVVDRADAAARASSPVAATQPVGPLGADPVGEARRARSSAHAPQCVDAARAKSAGSGDSNASRLPRRRIARSRAAPRAAPGARTRARRRGACARRRPDRRPADGRSRRGARGSGACGRSRAGSARSVATPKRSTGAKCVRAALPRATTAIVVRCTGWRPIGASTVTRLRDVAAREREVFALDACAPAAGARGRSAPRASSRRPSGRSCPCRADARCRRAARRASSGAWWSSALSSVPSQLPRPDARRGPPACRRRAIASSSCDDRERDRLRRVGDRRRRRRRGSHDERSPPAQLAARRRDARAVDA